MMLGMSAPNHVEPSMYPYALQIILPPAEGGSYHRASRKHGKLHQRSDRGFRSKVSARHDGMKQIERLLHTA